MRYAIRKPRPDLRRNTCGFSIEDGHVAVIDLTLDNVEAVKNVVMHGYIVAETQAAEGSYTENEFSLLALNGKQITGLSLGLVAKPRPELAYIDEL